MTDYNTMTAAQCADWLAERDGWNYVPATVTNCGAEAHYWWKWTISPEHGGRTYATVHPYASTLDAAAAALREPWYVHLMHFTAAHVSVRLWRQNTACWKNVHGPDELTARYRAAVAARMEDER